MNVVAEHRLRNDANDVRQLTCWVTDFAERAQLPAPVRNAFDLALEEWVTNVISHGCAKTVILRFNASPEDVRVEVEDDGTEFNPLTVPPADTTQPLETRPIGGLGIHLMRQVMDAVEYRHEGGRNILTLIKRIS